MTVVNLGAFATYQIAVTFSNAITKSIGEQNIVSDYVHFKTLPGSMIYLFQGKYSFYTNFIKCNLSSLFKSVMHGGYPKLH